MSNHRITTENLNSVMEFGRVIRVDADRLVTTDIALFHAPEVVYLQLDSDGQSHDDNYQDLPKGWEPFTAGYTGQHGYSGPTMHPSEYIGGGLARDILDTPGFYVAAAVDGMPVDDDSESEPIGWAVFRRDSDIGAHTFADIEALQKYCTAGGFVAVGDTTGEIGISTYNGYVPVGTYTLGGAL